MSNHLRKKPISTPVVLLITLTATLLSPALRAEDDGPVPAKSEKTANVDTGDGFDKLYGLRLKVLAEHVALYESVVDEASAEKAAKKWRTLLPLEIEIKKLDKKLGSPRPERQAELNKKYGSKMNEYSVRSSQLVASLVRKPYYQKIHLAQLQNAADQGDEDAKKALKIMLDPKAKASYEAKRKGETGKIKTDVVADRSVKAWIKTMNQVTAILDGVTDGPSANRAAPKVKKLAEQMEEQVKILNSEESRVASIEKHRAEIGKSIVALGANCSRLIMSKKNEVSDPLRDALTKILGLISD